MDNATAKTILAAYRPNGADAQDPRFAEALRQCENDPQARAALEQQLRQDRDVARALQAVPVPARGKSELLATLPLINAPARPKVVRFPVWSGLAALAAVVAFGLFVSLRNPAADSLRTASAPIPAAQAAALVEALLAHDRTSTEVASLRDWLASQGAPVAGTLPSEFAGAEGLGCAIVHGPDGLPVSIICVVVDGAEVHLVTHAVPPGTEPRAPGFHRTGDWTVAQWNDGVNAYSLVGTLPEDRLRALIAG
jgi:hypothetical protein